MKKIFLYVLSAAMVFMLLPQAQSNAAPSVTLTPPTYLGIPVGVTEMSNLEAQINDALGDWDDQQDLALGLGNSNAYAAQAANLWGYQGYSIFAIMVGPMIGVQAPSFNVDELQNVADKIETEGDVYAGMGIGSAVNVGVRIPTFVKKLIGLGFLDNNLYVNVKYFGYSMEVDDFDADTKTFGFGINYQLFKPRKLPLGVLKWRGLSVGTGLLYNSNEVNLTLEGLADIRENISGTVDMVLDPSITLGIDTTSYTIPFEVSTSLRLLWVLNLTLGAGVDFNFGNTDITIKQFSDIYVEDGGVEIVAGDYSRGSAAIDASTTDVSPSLTRARLMAGVGLSLGPVVVDMPVAWYLNSGASVGIQAGIVW